MKLGSAIFLLFLPIFLFAPHPLFAQGTPGNAFWYEPKEVSAGEKVTLTALIYNDSNSTAVYTVRFSVGEQMIGEAEVSVPSKTAKPGSVLWQAVAGEHLLSAKVIRGIRTSGRALSVLPTFAPLSISVLEAGERPAASKLDQRVGGWVGAFKDRLDAWRRKQFLHFAGRRDELKKIIDTPGRYGNIDQLAQPESASASDEEFALRPFWNKGESLSTYGSYIFFLGMAFLFGSATLFYLAAVLIAFLLVRGLYRRFV